MPLTVVQMDPDEFVRRRAVLVGAYAQAIGPARGLTVAEARAEAERDVQDRLPRGSATRGQLIRRALVDGTEVGWIWVTLPGRDRPGTAWLSDVEVDPPFRSRGYAGAMITALEAELVALGVPRFALNVFGDNGTAMRLYERLGFEVIAQQWARELTDVPSGEGVELVPITGYGGRIEAMFADYAQDLVLDQGCGTARRSPARPASWPRCCRTGRRPRA